jgi:hypothetical protein
MAAQLQRAVKRHVKARAKGAASSTNPDPLSVADKLHAALAIAPPRTFLHMPDGIAGHLVARTDPADWPLLRWTQLKCNEEYPVGIFQVKTVCTGTTKFFVRLGRRRLRDLRDYARLVRLGVIQLQDTRELVQHMSRILRPGEHLVNHNLEVGLLHFKVQRNKSPTARDARTPPR